MVAQLLGWSCSVNSFFLNFLFLVIIRCKMANTSNQLYKSLHSGGSIMNNQNDILLMKQIHINDNLTMIFILHDNRIYVFEKTQEASVQLKPVRRNRILS